MGSFDCNCTSTGYTGPYCQININECASNPCENNAECIDRINDYQCNCYPGYTGKNCEEDINECDPNPCQYNSTCLEKSNITLYSLRDTVTHLPSTFYRKFSYENASGYECICVTGTTGRNCEHNINECESLPCKNGNCIDGVRGNYINLVKTKLFCNPFLLSDWQLYL